MNLYQICDLYEIEIYKKLVFYDQYLDEKNYQTHIDQKDQQLFLVIINDISKLFQKNNFIKDFNLTMNSFSEINVQNIYNSISKNISFFLKVGAVQPYYICLKIKETLVDSNEGIELELENLYPALIESVLTYL